MLAARACVKVHHVQNLHAKVYVIDERAAFITSANLTVGGLFRNLEYSVYLDDRSKVRRVAEEIRDYGRLGVEIENDVLKRWCLQLGELQSEYKMSLRTAGARVLSRLRLELREVENGLIERRYSGTDGVTGKFAQTIQFLLRSHGALTTEQLHPLIQAIHGDLCNDSIDRVIQGVHYGKKWKHWVRSAQQRLKKQGTIELSDGSWKLRNS